MGGFTNPVFGGNTLIRPAVRSPNYQAGTQGWSINKDGSAEFNNLTLRGTFVGGNWVQNTDGLFFYSGTPAAGNLVGSWAPAAGTDAYGNTYPEGLQVTAGAIGSVLIDPTDGRFLSTGSSGQQVAIGDGALVFNQPTQTNQALIEQNINRQHGSLFMAPGNLDTADRRGTMELVTSYGFPTTGSTDTYPRTATACYSGDVVAYHYVTGAVVKTSDLTGNTAEVWQVPSLGTGWASGPSGGSFRGLHYRRDAEDNLIISGVVHTTSTTPSANLFTLASSWCPKQGERPGIVYNKAGTYTAGSLEIATTGVCTVDPVPTAASQDAYIYVSVPLGNVA